jgi:predicted nucleic acid-binding protein
MVVIDTDVIISAYRRADSPEKAEFRHLVMTGEAATVGIILAEVLRGAQSEQEFEEMTEELLAMEFLEIDQDIWLQAAHILFYLKRQGQIIPLPDAVIAAQALSGDHAVYSHDEHFRRIPGLKIHEAES